MKMLEVADLDLEQHQWCFSEEYTFTPERLMAGRDLAGYYFMIKDGKISGGAGVPQECLDLPGFHVKVAWGLIAHPSSLLLREGRFTTAGDRRQTVVTRSSRGGQRQTRDRAEPEKNQSGRACLASRHR